MLATKSTSTKTSAVKTTSTKTAVSLTKSAPVEKKPVGASEKKDTNKTTKTQVKVPPTSVSAQAITENVKLLEKGPKPLVKSAGAIIRECFIAALSSGLIDDKAMAILTSTEKTNEVLKIRYAFLLEVKTGNKEERMIKGNARYTAKPIVEYKYKKYYITNDLYARNIMVFQDWIETLRKEWKERLSKINSPKKTTSEKNASQTSSKTSSEKTSSKK